MTIYSLVEVLLLLLQYCLLGHAGALSFLLDQLGRSSESPITLNCPTTGLPPTAVFWRRSGELLSTGGAYEITTELRDRQNTTFDNFLRISQTPQQAGGIYRCEAVNALDGPIQNRTAGADITSGMNINKFLSLIAILGFDCCLLRLFTVNRFIAMYTVGGSDTITCTLGGVLSSGYQWIDEDGNVIIAGRQLVFSANDSIHHSTFTCYGLSFTTFQFRFLHIKFVINGEPLSLRLVAIFSLEACMLICYN